MDFGVLGPISVWEDGESLPVGGPRQRCVLGALLAAAGKEVAIDRLIGYLWDDAPPRTARSVIQVQVSHLRRAFPHVIVTTPGGYMADVDPLRVDLYRFRDHVNRAQAASTDAEAILQWDLALACWRGRPFSGTGADRLWWALGQPLEEEHWATVGSWAECAFNLRRYEDIVMRLTPLLREEPLRERQQYLLLASLYRSGQRAAALSTYQSVRRNLADELGVDPGPEMTELHQRILKDTEGEDERKETPPSGLPVVDADHHAAARNRAEPVEQTRPETLNWALRNDLPRDTPDFTGRDDDLALLLAEGGRRDDGANVYVVTGAGGVGKTTFAVHVAHKLASEYPDGQFFIDLYGFNPDQDPMSPEAALAVLLRATGVASEGVPDALEERSALWRSRLTGRRVLVVLDNAIGHSQVEPLLSAAAGSLTIVTTRHDMPGLSGVGHVSLGMLSEEESLELFRVVLGPDRVDQETERALQVARLCGGLPLALRIVAGRMLKRPRWNFEHVARRLGEERRRFRELQVEGQSVEAVFELSYQSLTADQQRAFCMLGVMIGASVDLLGSTALLGMSPPEADDLLQELVSVCLLDEPAADHYRFHDLIGAYAREKAGRAVSDEDTAAARWRLADHYLDTADRAADFLGPRAHEYEVSTGAVSRYTSELKDTEEAVSWFERHQDNLASVVDFFAAERAGDYAWQIADAVWRFYASYGRTELLLATQEKALAVNREQGNERGSAVTLIGLGIAHYLAGRYTVALDMLNDAGTILRQLGDQRGLIRVDANLGMVYERLGRLREAVESLSRVWTHARTTGDLRLEALQGLNLGSVYQVLGESEKAIEAGESIIRASREAGTNDLLSAGLRVAGEARVGLGRVDEAVGMLEEAVTVARANRDASDEVFALSALAVALRESGRMEAAVDTHNEALFVGEKAGLRNGDAEILNALGVTLAGAGRLGEAYDAQRRSLALARERQELYIEARALLSLGILDARAGGPEEESIAHDRLTAAAAILDELGVPEAEDARVALQSLTESAVPAPRQETGI